MKTGKSIFTSLILVIVFFATSFFIFYKIFSRNIESSSIEHLNSISSLKQNALHRVLEDIELSLLTLDKLPITEDLFKSNCAKTKDSCELFAEHFNVLDETKNNIDGLYFFNNQGELFFDTNKDIDDSFRTVISQIVDKRSVQKGNIYLPIKTIRSQSYHQIFFSDMFEDTKLKPHMFALLARYDEDGDLIGTIIGQIPLSIIDEIFIDETGLRNSGETYIIGNDLIMRTNSRLSSQKTRLTQIINTENAHSCFNNTGQVDSFSSNYRNTSVLGVYSYIPQLDWCLLSEINEAEVNQIQGVLVKVELLLGIIFTGVLFYFFEKIIAKTRAVRKKQIELTDALFEKEKFEKAVNTASDNISIIDGYGNVLYVNKALSKNSGFHKEKTIGKNINTLWWSKVEKDILREILRTTYNDKKPSNWEITSNKENGETYPAEIFITPILSDDGEFLFALVIEHDIRERKKLESMKNEFIGVASHELRTPMTIIRGYVGLLNDGTLGKVNPKQKEILGKIDSNSKRLIEMVKDMLDITKLESQERYKAHKSPLNLETIVKEISTEFTTLLKEKNITYSLENTTYCEIVSDESLLKRVLINLIGNAIKFTDVDGSITVSIKPAKHDDCIRVEIKDSGIGIPESQRDLVFKKFSQVENYLSKKRTDGTGLGLAICQQIMNILGGMIDFESTEGVGSTFYFEIPRD